MVLTGNWCSLTIQFSQDLVDVPLYSILYIYNDSSHKKKTFCWSFSWTWALIFSQSRFKCLLLDSENEETHLNSRELNLKKNSQCPISVYLPSCGFNLSYLFEKLQVLSFMRLWYHWCRQFPCTTDEYWSRLRLQSSTIHFFSFCVYENNSAKSMCSYVYYH